MIRQCEDERKSTMELHYEILLNGKKEGTHAAP